MRRNLILPLSAGLVLLTLLFIAGCERGPGEREEAAAPAEAPEPGPTPQVVVEEEEEPEVELPPLFDDIEQRTFRFFWETTNPDNGLTPDRHPSRPFSSVAAVGFALTAYGIGVENGWVTRDEAIERTLVTLRFFRDADMGPEEEGRTGHRGFFYHFIDMDSGHRFEPWVELSSVDTGLLMMGVLFAQAYFDGDDPREAEIREIADQLYGAVEWPWLQQRPPLISMGWYPDGREFIEHDWTGYDEAMLVYILALGSPTHPVEPEAWEVWTGTYEESWGVFQGQEYLSFAPQFGHQYTHTWVDFRGIRDAYMADRGIDYFENSRRATWAQRDYAIENPMGWEGYGENEWGLTASDGPQNTIQEYNGEQREFRHYSARGAGLVVAFDDGTIVPTAALASIAFAPEIVIAAAEHLHDAHGEHIYGEYGFLDSFNRSFHYDIPLKTGRIVPDFGWVASDWIAIDQGPILAMIANHRSGFVWEVMKRSPYIRAGLERAGFTGGWLAGEGEPSTSGPADEEAANARAMGMAQSHDEERSAEPSAEREQRPPREIDPE